MDIILLAGENPKNEEWLNYFKNQSPSFLDSCKFLKYDHWRKKDKHFDLDLELKKLEKLARKSKDYVIIAKSAGTVLTLKGVYEQLIIPEKCVFLGIPLNWANKKKLDLKSWLKNYSINSFFLQQENDKMLKYDKLIQILDECEVKNYKSFKIPGKDHQYKNINQFFSLIDCFIKS